MIGRPAVCCWFVRLSCCSPNSTRPTRLTSWRLATRKLSTRQTIWTCRDGLKVANFLVKRRPRPPGPGRPATASSSRPWNRRRATVAPPSCPCRRSRSRTRRHRPGRGRVQGAGMPDGSGIPADHCLRRGGKGQGHTPSQVVGPHGRTHGLCVPVMSC